MDGLEWVWICVDGDVSGWLRMHVFCDDVGVDEWFRVGALGCFGGFGWEWKIEGGCGWMFRWIWMRMGG